MRLFPAIFLGVTSMVLLVGCPKKKPPPTPTPTPAPEATPQDDAPVPTAECDYSTIYFDFDMADLKPAARSTLRELADCLKTEAGGASIRIAGHCDERGSTEYNLALGERRSGSVREYLINLGVPSSRLEAISYGEEKPARSGSTEDAWTQNRRVEFERR